MTIPVIILNYNSLDNTKKCIRSFEKSDFNHFFIIVDNNSKNQKELQKVLKYDAIDKIDISKEAMNKIKKDNGVIITLNKNYGYSYANNIGLNFASILGFEYAIVANPDTEIIDITYFNVLKDKLDFVALFPEARGINNEIQGLYYDKNWLQLLLFNFFNIIYKIYDKLYKKIKEKEAQKKDYIEIDYSIGCFIFFNLKYFRMAGFFDDNVFLYGEEPIIYQKSKLLGKKVYYSSKLKIKHNHYYKELTDFVKKEHHKSRVYYYKTYKHYPKLLINLLELSSRFREEVYEKLYSKLK